MTLPSYREEIVKEFREKFGDNFHDLVLDYAHSEGHENPKEEAEEKQKELEDFFSRALTSYDLRLREEWTGEIAKKKIKFAPAISADQVNEMLDGLIALLRPQEKKEVKQVAEPSKPFF